MYIKQNSVKQRLGSFEGTFGQLSSTNYRLAPGYTLKQSGNTYYLLNAKGQQASQVYTFEQIKQSGGIKDYQDKLGLTYVAPKPAAPTSAFSLNLTGSGGACIPTKAGTCDMTGQCYDPRGCPISDKEAERVYQTPTPKISQPVSTGPSAGEVLTGVGSILSALATPAAGIFQTYTEAKMAKDALKRQQQQQMMTPAYNPMPQVITQGPSTGLILGLVGGFAAIALILVLVLKK